MPKRAPKLCSVSVLTLPKRTLGSNIPAACSNCGAIILQGPHQLAQKSTNRGKSDLPAWRSKLAALSSMGFPVNNPWWHLPQLGCSVRREPGTRFCVWQAGQMIKIGFGILSIWVWMIEISRLGGVVRQANSLPVSTGGEPHFLTRLRKRGAKEGRPGRWSATKQPTTLIQSKIWGSF